MKKPEAPVLFLKPSTSYITQGIDIVVSSVMNSIFSNQMLLLSNLFTSQIPEVLTNVHHECELGVIIAKKCKNVSVEDARQYIGGYCLGLDLSAFCELVNI